MALKMYEKMTGCRSRQPRVTLTLTQLNFNPPAVAAYFDPMVKKRRYKSGCIPYVELGYDAAAGEIWMFPAETEGPRAMAVQQKKGEAARISVSGFLKQFDLLGWCHHLLACRVQETEFEGKKIHVWVLTKTEVPTARKVLKPKPSPAAAPAPSASEAPDNPPRPAVNSPRREAAPPEPSVPRGNYQCSDCGYSNLGWKYSKMYRGTWHPPKCPKCNSTHFEPAA